MHIEKKIISFLFKKRKTNTTLFSSVLFRPASRLERMEADGRREEQWKHHKRLMFRTNKVLCRQLCNIKSKCEEEGYPIEQDLLTLAVFVDHIKSTLVPTLSDAERAEFIDADGHLACSFNLVQPERGLVRGNIKLRARLAPRGRASGSGSAERAPEPEPTFSRLQDPETRDWTRGSARKSGVSLSGGLFMHGLMKTPQTAPEKIITGMTTLMDGLQVVGDEEMARKLSSWTRGLAPHAYEEPQAVSTAWDTNAEHQRVLSKLIGMIK